MAGTKKDRKKDNKEEPLILLDSEGEITIPIGYNKRLKKLINLYIPLRSNEKN